MTSNTKRRIKALVQFIVPYHGAWLMGQALRLYVTYSPFRFGKTTIVLGGSIFRICSWHKIETIVHTRFGTRHRIRFPDMIQMYLFYFGIWEPEITAVIRQRLSPGDIFIDVGANIGYYTCLASRLVASSGRVHAIDASPTTFERLLESLRLNGAENVITHHAAAFDRETTLQLHAGSVHNIGQASVIEGRIAHPEAEAVDVRALPLNRIVGERDLYRARLIKIDVEGAEWFVVNGIKALLPRFDPRTEWVIELAPRLVEAFAGDIAGIAHVFKDAGYRMYAIDNNYHPRWYIDRGRAEAMRPLRELVEPGLLNQDHLDVLFTRQPCA
jgi:FkbM family methyltransferase